MVSLHFTSKSLGVHSIVGSHCGMWLGSGHQSLEPLGSVGRAGCAPGCICPGCVCPGCIWRTWMEGALRFSSPLSWLYSRSSPTTSTTSHFRVCNGGRAG